MMRDISDVETLTKNLTLDEIAELIPGWLHLNNTVDFGLEYMSPRMEKDFRITTEEVKQVGISYIQQNVHPETSERVVPQLIDLVKSGDKNKILSFYQNIKLPGKDYEWFLTTSKLYGDEHVISTTIPLSVLKDFDGRIIEILNENVFIRSNLIKYNALTRRELEVIKHLVKGVSNTLIAKSLNLSEHTIKTHRQNIYKKLEISNIIELVKFAKSYGI